MATTLEEQKKSLSCMKMACFFTWSRLYLSKPRDKSVTVVEVFVLSPVQSVVEAARSSHTAQIKSHDALIATRMA
jgi:hypothetical protein